jgi:hypothetical protein
MGLSFKLPLGLASAVILGSESRGSRVHILLSQSQHFPFCRLLRLVGLQWRYSSLFQYRFYCCVRVLRVLLRNGSTLLLVTYLLLACLPCCFLAMGLHVTVLIVFNVNARTLSFAPLNGTLICVNVIIV